MKQLSVITRVIALMGFVVAVLGVSVFGDERPEWRTAQSDLRMDVRAPDLIEGVVADVTRNGDDIFLRTGAQTIRIEAHGGIKVWYRGHAYRVRDLERGDVVRVDLEDRRSNRYRARSIEVLRSVSHDGAYGRPGRGYGYRDYDRGYEGHGQRVRLEGRVLSIDHRREQMVIRVDAQRDFRVDLRYANTGDNRRPLRTIRTGDIVSVEGRFDRGVFVAQRLDELRGRQRRNY